MNRVVAATFAEARAIENSFPIGFVSQLAEHESWRKEVYRPIYYIHKWWARRLGSVLRAVLIASCVDRDQDISRLFYRRIEFPGVVIFDPFMGSGTTIGEAVKLGCRVIGRDINPVSLTMVGVALKEYSEEEVQDTFGRLAETAGERIRALYTTTLPNGEKADVLYYFWVKTIPCPVCDHEIELFKSRVFAKHAMPEKHPEAKALCPECRAINDVRFSDLEATCQVCGAVYNPQRGEVDQPKVTCRTCGSTFNLVDAVRRSGLPLSHKMYAKLVLQPDGRKTYLQVDQGDEDSYRTAEKMLRGLWQHVPQVEIQPGYNTNQVINYNYRKWHQMFNARQLASLALLVAEISKIRSPELKSLFACLFSGVLEFNNMFASFKGEGTGAVRHMFAHHILKPELTPLEANVWGTPKSSGSFSTLFRTRILRALDYKQEPFELKLSTANGNRESQKVFGLSRPMNQEIVSDYPTFLARDGVYLSAGDSSCTDLPDESVDLVVTDPPFFDNVHYSQLADFFYVWLRQILGPNGSMSYPSTRSSREVQSTDPDEFANNLTAVFSECRRVLKRDGLLVFTYHHSRIEGWSALYKSVRQAGFYICRTHPVKAEMAVAVPIRQSKEPISFDLVIVCRKTRPAPAKYSNVPLEECLHDARHVIQTLQREKMPIAAGDARVILMGHILAKLASIDDLNRELLALHSLELKAASLARQVVDSVERRSSRSRTGPDSKTDRQLALLERKKAYRAKRRGS